MTECLDEETILAFCRGGGVAVGKRPAIEAHLAECDECRALVSAVARSSLVDPKELIGDPNYAPTTPAAGLDRSDRPAISGPSGPSSSPVRPGDLLAGKYEVERVLGVGGMGVVVAVRHTQLDQRFAIKFLLPAACETPGAITRFLREGKAAARITSEHVARVVDTGVLETGAPYLVMEYLEGSDLSEVTSKSPLSEANAIEYVLQASEAIVEAHELGIVHRDLKPANIFLARHKDGSPLVKVLDFGISKSTDGGERSQLTSTSMLMGSPRYMSPEQMVSAKDVDARTDVWALGVILFELVSGKPVWQADTIQGLCALIAASPAPMLRQYAPHATLQLEAVIARCLMKAPNERMASVADLAMSLEPLAPNDATRASIERILRVAGRSRGDHRSVSPPRAVSPAVAVPAATRAAPPPPPTKASSSRMVVALLSAVIVALVIAGVTLNVVATKKTDDLRADPSTTTGLVAAAPSTLPSTSPMAIAAAASDLPPAPIPSTTTTTTRGAGQQHHRPRGPSAVVASTTTTPPPTPLPPPSGDTPNRALTDRK